MAAWAQDEVLTVNSLQEAKDKSTSYMVNIELLLPENKVQVTRVEGWYVYLWDGEAGFQFSGDASRLGLLDAKPGQYVNGKAYGIIYSDCYYLYFDEAAYEKSELTLGEVAPLVPKDVKLSDMTKKNTYDYIKAYGEVEGEYFIDGSTQVGLPMMEWDQFYPYDFSKIDGCQGYLTGIFQDNWGTLMIKPIEENCFDEVVKEIKTQFVFDGRKIKDFKEIADTTANIADGVLAKLRMNANVQILHIDLDEANTVVDLWDGVSGIRLQGDALYDIFKKAKSGQHVKGYIIGKTYGSKDKTIIHYDKALADGGNWFADDAAEITIGRTAKLTPAATSFAELDTADLSKSTYDFCYVEFLATPDYDENQVLYAYKNSAKTSGILMNEEFYRAEDTSFQGKKAMVNGMLVRTDDGQGFQLYLLDKKFVKVIPETTFIEEANGIAQLKEISTEWGKQVKLNLTDAQLVFKDEGGYNFILWDGQDGLRLQGGSDVVEALGNAEIGQLISGYIIGITCGPEGGANYFSYADYNPLPGSYWDARTASEFTLGEIAPIKPRVVSLAELEEAVGTNKYANSYIGLKGEMAIDSTEYGATCNISIDSKKLKLNNQLYTPKDTIANGSKGMFYVLFDNDEWSDPQYKLLVLNEDYFRTTELALDALKDNEEAFNSKHAELVTLTIDNLDIQQGKWNGVVLPTDLTEDQVTEIFGLDTKVYVLDKQGTEYEYKTLEFVTNPDNMMKAGHSYLVVPTKEVKTIVIEDATVSTELVPTEAAEGYIFQGFYAPTTLAEGNHLYVGEGEEGVQFFNYEAEATVNAFTSYFTTPEKANEILIKLDGITVGINDINTGAMPADAKVYNLQGQNVGTNLKGLAKGIYIVNGKKVLVK